MSDRKKSINLIDPPKLNLPLSRLPSPDVFLSNSKRSSIQLQSLNFYNKDNENKNLGVERYQNTDSYINRISQSSSSLNFQKEDD
jgi:hypothetical protein